MFEGEVVLQRPAHRYLEKLSLDDRARIINALQILSTGNFNNIDVKPLKGRPGWRLRVGNYRVLFLVEQEKQIFLVTDIGSRGDIYKNGISERPSSKSAHHIAH